MGRQDNKEPFPTADKELIRANGWPHPVAAGWESRAPLPAASFVEVHLECVRGEGG